MLLFALLSAKNGKSKYKLFFGAFILILLMGFKSTYVGNDTPSYIEFFNRLSRMTSLIDSNSRFEVGYQFYNKIISLFFDNYQAMFLITAIICITCICYGIVNLSRNWQYSLFLFVGLRFYYFFLSGLRQSLAVSIIVVSYVCLRKKHIIPFILLVILATTFHFSAFIFILAWPLSQMKISKGAILKVTIGIVAVYAFFGPILNISLNHLPIYYSHYLTTEAVSVNNLSDFINAIIPCLFVVFSYFSGYYQAIKDKQFQKSIENDDEKTYITSLYSDGEVQLLFFFVAAGLSLVATRASILDRMAQYYWIFSIMTVPNILFFIRDKQKRTSWYFVITTCVIIYNISLLILRPEWNAIVPYTFFWN